MKKEAAMGGGAQRPELRDNELKRRVQRNCAKRGQNPLRINVIILYF
jgi:hypothetical protein